MNPPVGDKSPKKSAVVRVNPSVTRVHKEVAQSIGPNGIHPKEGLCEVREDWRLAY